MRKCFTVPGNGIGCLGHSPGCVAVTLIVKCVVVSPAGLLRRRVKTDVGNINTGPQGHTEGLDSAVEILVIQSVLIVPDPGSWVSHLVSEEPDAIIPRIGLDLVHCHACPSHEGRSPSNCGVNRGKCEASCAGDAELPIRNVVVHVAFARMVLAPCVLVGSHILGFGEVCSALVQALVQIIDVNPHPMRYAIVRMAAVVVRRGWISTGEWIDPCARTDAGLAAI